MSLFGVSGKHRSGDTQGCCCGVVRSIQCVEPVLNAADVVVLHTAMMLNPRVDQPSHLIRLPV